MFWLCQILASMLLLPGGASQTAPVPGGGSGIATEQSDLAVQPTAEELADRLSMILRDAPQLEVSSVQSAHLYESSGSFHSLEEAGEAAWFVTSHKGYARSVMTPDSFHMEAWRGTEPTGKPLMIVTLDQGMVTERQWRPEVGEYEATTYDASRPGGTGDITLQSYFYQQGIPLDVKVCNFSYLLSTWVGPDTSVPDALARNIRNASVSGIVNNEGRPCYLLTQEFVGENRSGGYSGRVDTHWIDVDSGLITRWETSRTACSPDGQRSSFMNDVRTYVYTMPDDSAPGTVNGAMAE